MVEYIKFHKKPTYSQLVEKIEAFCKYKQPCIRRKDKRGALLLEGADLGELKEKTLDVTKQPNDPVRDTTVSKVNIEPHHNTIVDSGNYECVLCFFR